ncbi:S8 family serine peptidase [Rhodoligotrophos defluvii]|uniref:S8 family serine peptidase n=1 Tax=Rhodoligotrophos defluvii TaxID=2561934 RepID=UPI0010C9AD3C|nr:S8 family serine peptidase [Rhodoligotrophos defluvii]
MQATVTPAAEMRAQLGAHSPREIVASGLTEQDLQRLSTRGFRVETSSAGRIGPKLVRLQIPRGHSLEQARYAVREVNGSATTELDYLYFLDGEASCTSGDCSRRQSVGWRAAQAIACGTVGKIGLIDTRIDLQDPSLTGRDIEVVVARRSDTRPADAGHGTAVAALLVGQGDLSGLVPEAALVAADAFYRGPDDERARTDVVTLVQAIEMLAEKGVQVINLSLSGPDSPILRQAVAAALQAKIVLVAAVGNEGPHAPASYPAAYDGVIAVTAIDREGNIYPRANQGAYVDLSAPGVDLVLAGGGGGQALRSGSSYAAPFATAAAAQLLGFMPDLPPARIRSVLATYSVDLGAPGRDPVFGDGLVQVGALCRAAETRFALSGRGMEQMPAAKP